MTNEEIKKLKSGDLIQVYCKYNRYASGKDGKSYAHIASNETLMFLNYLTINSNIILVRCLYKDNVLDVNLKPEDKLISS